MAFPSLSNLLSPGLDRGEIHLLAAQHCALTPNQIPFRSPSLASRHRSFKSQAARLTLHPLSTLRST
jgi:hypothetical protein